MRLHFWGTRGNLATPSVDTIEFGGNTTCLQIFVDDARSLLIDCGTGIIEYASAASDCAESDHFHILVTHFHWDHMLGFPFFFPIHSPSARIDFYSPFPAEALRENIAALFDGTYSPLRSLDALPAAIHFHRIPETGMMLHGAKIRYCATDHPEACYAFRIDHGNTSLCVALDHESRGSDMDSTLVQFAQGVDLLVHDGQFTEHEYRTGMTGYGHSTIEQAIGMAERAGAKSLLLTHHHPLHSDNFLRLYLSRLKRHGSFAMEVELARERVDYTVGGPLRRPLTDNPG